MWVKLIRWCQIVADNADLYIWYMSVLFTYMLYEQHTQTSDNKDLTSETRYSNSVTGKSTWRQYPGFSIKIHLREQHLEQHHLSFVKITDHLVNKSFMWKAYNKYTYIQYAYA